MKACLRTLLVLSFLLLPVACRSRRARTEPDAAPPAPDTSHHAEGHNGVVVSVSGPASEAGLGILKRGGNAVDAAVATAFALAVSFPAAGNLGGGGFMLIHPAPGGGAPIAVDYRETAPAAATPTMFGKDDSQYTHRAVATPGTVRGMALAHRRFGSLPWAELLRPAIALARRGFLFDGNLAENLNVNLTAAPEAAEFQRVFGKPGGGPWRAGDRLVQPDLAVTLELLADKGPDTFYAGPLAGEIVAEMVRGKGLITAADLAGYRAIERKPVTTRYHGYDVYAPPPPSSGGICLVEELNMLEAFDLTGWGRWAPRTFHVLAETMRRANYDRARYIGDPAFVQIPGKLTDRAYAHELARTIDLQRATPSTTLSRDIKLSQEGENTTHLSIIDSKGMAVGNTFTLERRWGSRVVVKNRGFLLNNDMFAFNLVPGVTDTKGNIGTPPNTIAPGKRMVTSQSPTIVAQDGRVKLVTGSPGSRAIPNTILCVLLNVLDFHMPLQTAVESPRLSHQWLPDQITFETPERYPELTRALTAMGHSVIRTTPVPQGDTHSIWVAGPNNYVGVADRRVNGMAVAY